MRTGVLLIVTIHFSNQWISFHTNGTWACHTLKKLLIKLGGVKLGTDPLLGQEYRISHTGNLLN